MSKFHPLTVATVTRETRDAIALTFEVPPDLREQFRFVQGQHLTLRADIDGEDVRRSYSICSAVQDEVLRIAVKTRSREEAEKLRMEVDPLAINGAYGTGKWATSAPGSRVRPVIGLYSTLVPRSEISVEVRML